MEQNNYQKQKIKKKQNKQNKQIKSKKYLKKWINKFSTHGSSYGSP